MSLSCSRKEKHPVSLEHRCEPALVTQLAILAGVVSGWWRRGKPRGSCRNAGGDCESGLLFKKLSREWGEDREGSCGSCKWNLRFGDQDSTTWGGAKDEEARSSGFWGGTPCSQELQSLGLI